MQLTVDQKQRAADAVAILVDGKNHHQGMRDLLAKYGCDMTYSAYYSIRTGKTPPTKCLIDALCRFRKVDRGTVLRESVYDALSRCKSYTCSHGQ